MRTDDTRERHAHRDLAIARCGAGLLLLAAGVLKIVVPDAPFDLRSPMAVATGASPEGLNAARDVLAWIEVAAGLALVVGRVAAPAAVVALGVASFGLSMKLASGLGGDFAQSCGCLGRFSRVVPGPVSVTLDVLLLLSCSHWVVGSARASWPRAASMAPLRWIAGTVLSIGLAMPLVWLPARFADPPEPSRQRVVVRTPVGRARPLVTGSDSEWVIPGRVALPPSVAMPSHSVASVHAPRTPRSTIDRALGDVLVARGIERDGSFALPVPGELSRADVVVRIDGCAKVIRRSVRRGDAVQVVMRPAARLEVRVLGASGHPVAGTRVHVEVLGCEGVDEESESELTGDDGRAGFTSLGAGPAIVQVEATADSQFVPAETTLEPGYSRVIEVRGVSGKDVAGTVVDAHDGAPLEGATVSDVPGVRRARTDGNGSFLLHGWVRDLGASLRVECAGYAPAWQPLVDVNPVRVALSRAACVTGRVVAADGTPVPSAVVELTSGVAGVRRPQLDRAQVADSSGRFSFHDAAPGDAVRVHVRSETQGAAIVDGRVTVAAGGIQDLGDIVLSPTARVNVRLLQDGPAEPGVQVCLYRIAGEQDDGYPPRPDWLFAVVRASPGHPVVFDGVAAGKYRVLACRSASTVRDAVLAELQFDVGREGVDVDIDLRAGPETEAVVRVLWRDTGGPVEGASVSILSGADTRAGVTGRDGRVRLRRPKGGGTVRVHAGTSATGAPIIGASTELQCDGSETTVTTPSGTLVAGRVLNASGVAVSGASVAVVLPSGALGTRTRSRADGSFALAVSSELCRGVVAGVPAARGDARSADATEASAEVPLADLHAVTEWILADRGSSSVECVFESGAAPGARLILRFTSVVSDTSVTVSATGAETVVIPAAWPVRVSAVLEGGDRTATAFPAEVILEAATSRLQFAAVRSVPARVEASGFAQACELLVYDGDAVVSRGRIDDRGISIVALRAGRRNVVVLLSGQRRLERTVDVPDAGVELIDVVFPGR